MSDPIGMYFQHSQLSMAAYSDFTADMSSIDYKRALKAAGFTDSLADTFWQLTVLWGTHLPMLSQGCP